MYTLASVALTGLLTGPPLNCAAGTPLNVTVRSSGRLHSWKVTVLRDPLVEVPRMMIGFGVSLVHLRSKVRLPSEKTVASRPAG